MHRSTDYLSSISSTFYARIFCTKFWRQKLQSWAKHFVQNFGAKNVLSYEKCLRKMLMKSPPAFNFINVLRTAFTHVDLESIRIQSNPQYLFTLLGSTSAKAIRKTLVKSPPDLNSALSQMCLLHSWAELHLENPLHIFWTHTCSFRDLNH